MLSRSSSLLATCSSSAIAKTASPCPSRRMLNPSRLVSSASATAAWSARALGSHGRRNAVLDDPCYIGDGARNDTEVLRVAHGAAQRPRRVGLPWASLAAFLLFGGEFGARSGRKHGASCGQDGARAVGLA
jgi:hypothetical protein